MTSLFSASWKNPGISFHGLSKAPPFAPNLAWQQGLSAPTLVRRGLRRADASANAGWLGATTTFSLPALTGLIGWWDASVFASMTLGGGSVVTAIADQSGAGNNLTATGDPTYGATFFNSKPGIQYGSTQGDGLIKSSLALGTGSTLTLFAAMFMNDPAVNGIGLPAWIFSYTASGAAHDYDNVGSFAVVRGFNNANVEFDRNNVVATGSTLGYATNRRVIITIKSDGTWVTYVDGVAVTDAKIANNWVSPGYFGLGISKNDSSIFQQFGGVIAEAGIATGWHDATTVALLDTYLKNKWGL